MIRKTVIVTGASGGIGSATALKFASHGWNVALTYNRHKTLDLEEKIKSFNVDCKSYQMNVTDSKNIEDVFNKIFSDFDSVDAVVCNAGIAEKEYLFADKSIEELDLVINTNLRGTMICNHEAVKHLMKKGGVIVNVASILGKVGCACEVAYSASKAGVIGLTKALSKEVGGMGIRVNAVAPGMIETNMTAEFSKEEKDWLKSRTTLRRLGDPKEVADLIYFLASDDSKFITGQCVEVSGGLLL